MEIFHKTQRILQVIILALAAGLMVLGAVMIYMVVYLKPGGFIGGQGPQIAGLPLMTVVLDGISLFILLLSFLLPPVLLNFLTNNWAKQAKPISGDIASWETGDLSWLNRVPPEILTSLLLLFQSNRIATVALCEAAGMISCIAYLLEAQLVSLILMITIITLMIWRLPTQTMLSNWVFKQMERVKREQ